MPNLYFKNQTGSKIQVLVRGQALQNLDIEAGDTQSADAAAETPLTFYWRDDGSQCTEEGDGGNNPNRYRMPADDSTISLPSKEWPKQTIPAPA